MSTVNQIFSNDPNGVDLTILETAKGAPVPLGKGPFTIVVADPANTCKHVAGSADQTTPDSLVPNGTGNVRRRHRDGDGHGEQSSERPDGVERRSAAASGAGRDRGRIHAADSAAGVAKLK